MNIALGRRLLAEAVGTALLVVFGAGALVAALETGQGELDYAGLGIVAISFALVIAVGDLHVRHDLGRTHQPGGHVLAGRGAAIPVGGGRAVHRSRSSPGRIAGALLVNAIFGSQASDLNVSGGTIVGAGFTKAQAVRRRGARDVPADGHDHGARGRPARSGGVRRAS